MSGKEKASILDFRQTNSRHVERTPLIGAQGHGNGSSNHHRGASFAKFRAVLAAEGEPSYLKSFRWIIFGSFVLYLYYLRDAHLHTLLAGGMSYSFSSRSASSLTTWTGMQLCDSLLAFSPLCLLQRSVLLTSFS